MSKTSITGGQTPTLDDYKSLSKTLKILIGMFNRVAEKTPEMKWWSINVPEDITTSGMIHVTLNRWSEVLGNSFVKELCNLGGIGNKDCSKWTLYAVTGEKVTLKDYEKVADVCASAVKTLWIPKHPNKKLKLYHYSGNMFNQYSFSPEDIWKFREAPAKAFWICEFPKNEFPKFEMSVSKYLDEFEKCINDPSAKISSYNLKGYWSLNWFEFVFNTALEPNRPFRKERGGKRTRHIDDAYVPYRLIDHNICDASITTLEILWEEVKERIESLSNDAVKFEQPTKEDQEKAGQGNIESKEQPWDENNLDYMQNSEAIATFTKSKMALSALSKLLDPNGSIRYMRKGQRARVHIGDFRDYASKHYVPDKLANEIADEVLANRAAQREEEDRRKRRTGK
jgi:hypothetical protein